MDNNRTWSNYTSCVDLDDLQVRDLTEEEETNYKISNFLFQIINYLLVEISPIFGFSGVGS